MSPHFAALLAATFTHRGRMGLPIVSNNRLRPPMTL